MVRRYTSSDFPTLQEWGKAWDIQYKEEYLPPIGFIVENTAAYFLYTTPSKVCFMENMISNRECPKEEVDKALELIVEAILIEAKELGFEVAHACTNVGAVVMRSLKSNCKVSPNYALITKVL